MRCGTPYFEHHNQPHDYRFGKQEFLAITVQLFYLFSIQIDLKVMAGKTDVLELDGNRSVSKTELLLNFSFGYNHKTLPKNKDKAIFSYLMSDCLRPENTEYPKPKLTI